MRESEAGTCEGREELGVDEGRGEVVQLGSVSPREPKVGVLAHTRRSIRLGKIRQTKERERV